MAALPLLQQSEPDAASLTPDANPLLQRMTLLDSAGSYRARESAWRAGVKGFAGRPWLGWGPENFIVVFGRHADGVPAEGHVHDRAHNELLEKAATEGLPGLAGYLVLWAFALHFIVRAAKALPPKERAFALLIGASPWATYRWRLPAWPPTKASMRRPRLSSVSSQSSPATSPQAAEFLPGSLYPPQPRSPGAGLSASFTNWGGWCLIRP